MLLNDMILILFYPMLLVRKTETSKMQTVFKISPPLTFMEFGVVPKLLLVVCAPKEVAAPKELLPNSAIVLI